MTTNFFYPFLSFLFLDPLMFLGKNQDPGSGINIPDPQNWYYSVCPLSELGPPPPPTPPSQANVSSSGTTRGGDTLACG
jgi:hypothetical protein